MEKLVRTRNAHLVQVKGELVAARNLAGRQATVGEAQVLLIQLQELAGSFRRTQTAIEEDQEDEEGIEEELNHREEFDELYYEAMDTIERYIATNIPDKAVWPAEENTNVKKNDGLQEAMRLLRGSLRVAMEDKSGTGGNFGTAESTRMEAANRMELADGTLESSFGTTGTSLLSSSGNFSKDIIQQVDGRSQSEIRVSHAIITITEPEVPVEVPQQAFVSSIATAREPEINESLLSTEKLSNLGTESFTWNSREQEEVLKLHQLTPSTQKASVLKRNTDECFVVRLRIGDSKLSDSDIGKPIIGTANRITATLMGIKIGNRPGTRYASYAPHLVYRLKVAVQDQNPNANIGGICDEIWGQQQQARNKEQVAGAQKLTGFLQHEVTESSSKAGAIQIPLKRVNMNKWQLMHSTTSELWSRWRVDYGRVTPWAIGSGEDESGPRSGLGRNMSGAADLVCASSCDKFGGSLWYQRVEAFVPQGGGVCSGGQPCSPSGNAHPCASDS